jgi:hypothetical protein
VDLRRLRKRLRKRLGLRRQRPPFAGRHYRRARRLLLDAIDLFNAADLPYAVDAGTLLGLVRDGDLIPWDNDLDLILPVEALPRLRALIPRLWLRGWKVSRTYRMAFDSEAWRRGDPRVVKVRSWSPWLIGPGSTLLDITVVYPDGKHYWWEMARRVCRVPREFLDGRGTLSFAGREVKVPRDHERYLELSYGDWRTPRPDFSHNDLGVIVGRGGSGSGGGPP